MKRLLIILIALLFLPSAADAQQYFIRGDAPQLYTQNIDGYNSPDSEHRAALMHLKYKVFRDDRPFVKYISLYAVPPERREATLKVLDIWVHSLIDSEKGGKKFAPLKPVTETLYYLDLRDYGWVNRTWDIVSLADIYFQQPWINDEDVAEVAKLLQDSAFANQGNFVSANIILRGDWFIYHTSDTTVQDDLGKQPLYYVLPYSTVGEPKNLDDFRKAWQVDADIIEDKKLEKGSIVEKGRSSVARNNRQIATAKTIYGYYYETSDVKNGIGEFNYLDNLQPFGLGHNSRDASEQITVNALGLQVYFLTDADDNRVEFADPTVARDLSAGHDVRVKTARSCIVCHPTGLNNVDNYFSRVLDSGISLKTSDRDLLDEIQNYFFDDFNSQIAADKTIYALAIDKLTGWKASEFSRSYNEFMLWYEKPLNLKQAAWEAGVPVEFFKAQASATPNGTLAQLIQGGKISRAVWEETDESPFVESMLLLYRSRFVLGNESIEPLGRIGKYQSPKREKREALKKPRPILEEVETPIDIRYDNKVYKGKIGRISKKINLIDKNRRFIRELRLGEIVYSYKRHGNLMGVFYHSSPTFEQSKDNIKFGYIKTGNVNWR